MEYGIWEIDQEYWIKGDDGIPISGSYGAMSAFMQNESRDKITFPDLYNWNIEMRPLPREPFYQD